MNAESLVAFFQALSSSLPAWFLWLGACVGHGFLMTTGLNVLYAWPLPHGLLKVTRKIDILAIFFGPALFCYAMDVFGSQQLSWESGTLRYWLAPYVVMCWIAGLFLAPGAQVLYWLRKQAPQVARESVCT